MATKFGDTDFIKSLHKKQEELDLEEQRILNGKTYKVKVSYTVSHQTDEIVEVLALDEEDAEELASQKVDAEEDLSGEVEYDSFEILNITDHRGVHVPDDKTRDMFRDAK